VGDDQGPVVEDVVRDEAVDEVHHGLPEFRRLSFELRDGFREAVGYLDVFAAQLAQQLHLVIAGDAERAVGLDHLHDDPENARDVRTAIDQIAEEDDLAPIRMPGCADVVAQPSKEGLELGAASMDVADDVEGAVIVTPVVPERLPFDGRLLDVFKGCQHEDVPKPLPLQVAQRLLHPRALAAHDMGTKLPVGPTLLRAWHTRSGRLNTMATGRQ
jgi:hypothetical protein